MTLIRISMLFACLVTFAISLSPSHAVIETVEFADQKTEQRYKKLIAELRCLVCQNQNIAESDADLAKDLRRKTAEMLNAGESDRHVRAYMRERYGDFVLYKPPFEGLTAILWISPIVLLVLVILGLIITIKRRQENPILLPSDLNDEENHKKVRELLHKSPKLDD